MVNIDTKPVKQYKYSILLEIRNKVKHYERDKCERTKYSEITERKKNRRKKNQEPVQEKQWMQPAIHINHREEMVCGGGGAWGTSRRANDETWDRKCLFKTKQNTKTGQSWWKDNSRLGSVLDKKKKKKMWSYCQMTEIWNRILFFFYRYYELKYFIFQ